MNGVPVAGMDTQSVMRSLRGLPGTSLSLLLHRDGVFESVEIIRTRSPDGATAGESEHARTQVPAFNSLDAQAAGLDVTPSSQAANLKNAAGGCDAATGRDSSSNEHAQTFEPPNTRQEIHGDDQEYNTEGALRPAHVDTSRNEGSTESESAENVHVAASRAAVHTNSMHAASSSTPTQQTASKSSDVSGDVGIKLERNVHGDLMV